MGGNRASFEELKQRAVKPKQQPHIGTVGSGAAAFEELKKRAAQQRYEEDSKKVNSDYINSFLGDAHSFLNDSKKGLDTISWESSMDEWERERRNASLTDLDYRANLIGYYLDRNGDAFDAETVSNLRTLLDAYKTDASNLTQGFSDANKYFSQWATEEDYNSFQEQQQNYEALLGLDLDSAQKEINELEKELERYTYLVLTGSPDAEKNTELLAMREKYGHDGNIRAMINQKTAFLNQAKRVQEGVRMSGVADPKSEFYDPDFDQYSGYVSTVKPYAFGKPGFGDETYEYINNPTVEYNLLLDGGRKSTARELIDANYNAYSADNPHSDGESSYEEKGYAYMTEAEVAIYNYYYAKEGKEAAEKYLDNIQETLNYRSATKQYENIKGKTALELVFATAAGLDQFENGVKNLFRDGDYIAPTNTQILSGMVRADLSDDGPKLPEWMGGASLGQAGYDLITTTSNMAPSILTSTAIGIINPTAGTIAGNLLMGASAAGNAYQEKLNLGYTKEQARSYGLMIGASEVILERLLGGIGKLGGSVLSNTVLKNLAMVDNVLARFARSAGGKILINAGSEALEEGLQSVIEPYLWQAVSGEEASVDWEEALYNALMGFVSGGMFEGFEAVGNTSNSIGGNQQIQSEIPAAEINADIPNVPLKPVQADRNGAEVITSASEDAQQYIQQRAQAASVRENRTAKTGKEAMQTTEKGSEASQRDYGVSDNGKAINTKTNQTVELQGFTESGKTLAIKTDSGTVTREDIAYADENQAVVYESILNLGIRDAGYANALLNLYRDDPGSVSSGDFVNGMVDAFVYGQHGMDVSDLERNATIAKLTPVQRNSAFYIGKQYAGKRTATAEAIARQNRIRARQAAKTADTKKASAAKGKVYYGYEGKTIDQREGKALTKRQQVGVDFAKRLAASRGMTIYFYESYAKDGKLYYRDENGVEQLADNGFYDPATKAIHIDLNAGDYGRGTVLFTIAHELTHYIKDTAPAQYKKLCSLLMKGYKAKGQSVSELVAAQQTKAKRRGEKLSFDEAYDEVIADSMESILTDGRVMELMGDLEDTDKSLADKVKKFFRDIAKLLEDTIDAYKGLKPDSAEGRLVIQMKDIYGQLQEVFAKGVYEGSEAAQGESVSAVDSEIKHSLRVFEDGKRFVDVQADQNLFDGLSVPEMNSLAKRLIRQKFANKVIGIDNKAYVNGASAHEYVFPSKAISSDIREAKLRAAPELDNLLDAGTNFRNAPDGADGHYHPSAIGGFDYFDTIFKVGNEYYSGVVNIQVIQRGKLLKDITKIRNITKDIISSYGENPKSDFLRDASMDSIRNPDEVVKENDPTATDKIKRSGRNTQSFTEAEAKAIQGIGRKSIHQFNGSDIKATEKLAERYWKEMGRKSPFFRAWFGDWRVNDQSQVQTADIQGNARGIQKNEDTGWNIQVSGKVFSETKNHTDSYNIAARPYLPYINDIVRKAVLLDTWGFDQNEIKSENSLLMHSLYAVADIGKGREVLKLYVEEMNDPSKEDTSKRAYQLQNVEKYRPTGKSSQNSASSISPVAGNVVTVADLLAYVKQTDKNFNPNLPSAVVNADGTPKVVYHGTEEAFDVFSYGHIGKATGTGILGDGFYFTDKKKLAKGYGKNVYPVYLQIKNPYIATESDAYKLRSTNLQAQGYDGVILHAPAGDVYMVPNNTQIKSATENIGTFDGTNPNIKRSAREHINADAAEQIQKENEQLKEDVSRLREMLKLQRTVTNGTKFTRTSVDAAARLLKQNAGAKGETRELAGLLNDLYEYIAKGEELTWEGVKEAAQPAAQWLMDHVEHKPQRSEYAEDILHTLRTSRVRLDDTQMAEVEYRYGSYNNFRKSMMGSIVFAKENSMSLDSQWQEWAGMYPDVFDSELSASDMPEALVEIIDRLRNSDTSALEYEYNRDMIEQDLIRQVYDTYWRVSTLKTFADVQQKEINRLKSKHANQMVKLRQDNRAKVEQMKAEHRAHLEMLRQAHKQSLEAQQAEIRKKHEASRKKAVEGKHKTELRGKIRNVVKELNDLLLNGDKKHHVPDNLKKAVAAALDLVNMDTVEAEERAAKYADLIAKEQAKAEPDQDKIDAYTMTMENILRQGEKMGQRLSELHNAYEEIQKSDDADIANAYDPVIAGSLQELASSIGDTSIRNMSAEQLQDVYDMYRMVLTRVREANKAFLNEKQESIRDLASRVVGEIKRTGGEHSHRVSALDPARKFLWNNLKPVYAFEHLGSETLTEVFNGVRKGEDVWARDVTEAREYYLDKSRKYGYDSWDFEKKYRFTSASDLDFELTLEQILSLYAYSKREQAHDHLRLGGFVFDSNIETYKDKGSKLIKYKVNIADAHQITPEILAEIIGTLTKEQMAFVDDMQDYLSATMGAKGNEVTMKMYGVKLFKEKFYFPLKSAKQFMFEQNEVSGEVKLKNSGFTNKVVAKANNPVILSNFMEVWSGHVNDMSMYHAFVLPLEDFNRVFNFNSPKNENQPSVSVKGTIQNAYSPAAVNYVKQLITDLNGGARSDSTTGIINKMMGLFKKGSVFASLSVVVQQPSAIARAAALLDTKYFIGSRVDPKRHKALWEEVKRYAPVAIIKEMGYFDTNMGKSTQDFITGREYSGFTEKMKALVTDSSYRDEILSKAPALADELAWCSIWEAVKRETRAKNPEMDTKGEAFLQKVGERFTEIITKTQVYDSVLSRSANMRSKDTGMKMATAFMAEPTTSINMIADALLQGKRGNKKYARTAIGAVIASQIFNSILVSFVYAGRDDDEEKTYWEKYLGTLTGEVFDSLNPLTYIPFIKDIVSIVQGYDVERSDMAVISDLWNAWQKLGNDNVSVYRKVEGFAGSIAQIFGLPVKNIMRDARGIYQTIASFINGGQTTKAGVGYAVKAALPEWLGGEETANQEQLYEAYLSGDQTHLSRVAERYADASAVSSAMRSAIKEHFTTGDISSATAISYLVKYTGMEKDDAYWKVEEWAYENETGEEFGKYNEFFTAVETGRDLKKVIKQYTDNGVELTTLSSQITSHFKPIYETMTPSKRAKISGYLLDAFAQCGVDQEDAAKKLQYWEFLGEQPDSDLNQWQVADYYEFAKPAGISADVYADYCERVNGIDGEGKKERRMTVIDSLPLTDDQKDALYFAEGWAESKLWQAPWHQ